MRLHVPFAQLSVHLGRIRRLRLRVLGLLGPKRAGPARRVHVSVRRRRQLALMNRALAADAPQLASMFAMFNELTKGERSVGVECLGARAWSRPTSVHIALLATLAAIVALCIALTSQIHTAVRPCLVSATSGPAYAPVRDFNCQAYPASNK